MKWVNEVKVGKVQPKPAAKYPTIRLPSNYAEIIGKKVQIYETEVNGCLAFMIVVSNNGKVIPTVIPTVSTTQEEDRFSKLEKQVEELKQLILEKEETKDNNQKIKADSAGFEPATCSLGGCRPIHARLRARPIASPVGEITIRAVSFPSLKLSMILFSSLETLLKLFFSQL